MWLQSAAPTIDIDSIVGAGRRECDGVYVIFNTIGDRDRAVRAMQRQGAPGPAPLTAAVSTPPWKRRKGKVMWRFQNLLLADPTFAAWAGKFAVKGPAMKVYLSRQFLLAFSFAGRLMDHRLPAHIPVQKHPGHHRAHPAAHEGGSVRSGRITGICHEPRTAGLARVQAA